ncbi:hypothetical protein TNCV_4221071 [Trichonephila clavipes]|nr:hypothetical protein TNCV_4221071 [Trichonephila clavipes]
MINFVVLIAVLYDLLWFINGNEQNIKKWPFMISLLKEDETDQAVEEPDEIMHINCDSESSAIVFFLWFFQTRLVISRRKQRSAFDQVSEFDKGRTVAYRDYELSFREIDSRVGRN